MSYSNYLKQRYGGGASSAPSKEETTTTKTTTSQSYADHLKSTYGNGSTSSSIKKTPTIPTLNFSDTFGRNKSVAEQMVQGRNIERDKIINQYESIPNHNILDRAFDKEAKADYRKKQELSAQYTTAKNAQTYEKLKKAGITDADLDDYFSGDDIRSGNAQEKLASVTDGLFKKKGYGITEKDKSNFLKERNYATLTDLAEKAPALASGVTVLTQPAEALANTATSIGSFISGSPIVGTGDITSQARGIVADKINNKVGKFAYNTGMSLADELTALGIQGLTGIPASTTQGIEKASSVVNDAAERGLSPARIMTEGIVSGAITTALTEKYGIGSLGKNLENVLAEGVSDTAAKQFAKYIAKQMASEGLQESSESIADTIADAIIGMDKSEMVLNFRNYMASNPDATEEEALMNVLGNKAKEVLLEGLGGAISGGIMGGGNFAINQYSANQNAKAQEKVEKEKAAIKEEIARVAEFQKQAEEERQMDAIQKEIQRVAEFQKQAEAERQQPKIDARIAEERNAQTDLTSLLNQVKMNDRINEENNANNQPDLTSLLAEANKIPNQPKAPTLTELVRETKPDVDSKLAELGANLPNESDRAKMKNVQNAIDKYFETGKLYYVQAAYLEVAKNMDNSPAKTELALYLGDLITEQIDNPNSPYGKYDELQSELGKVNIPRTEKKEQIRIEPTYDSETFANPYIPYVSAPNPEIDSNLSGTKLKNAIDDNISWYQKTGKDEYLTSALEAMDRLGGKDKSNARTNNASVTNIKPSTSAKSGTNLNARVDVQQAAPTVNEVNTEDVFKDNPIQVEREKTSQYATNTLFSEKFFGRSKEMAKRLDKENQKGRFDRDSVHEAESIEQAHKLLVENGEERVKTSIENSDYISNVQIDAGAMILEGMISKGDINGAIEFANRMTDKIHNAAQGLQSLAKYTRSATGTVMKSLTMRKIHTDEYFNQTRNKEKAKQCSKIVGILKGLEAETSTDAKVPKLQKTYRQIYSEVEATIKNSDLTKNFTADDIEMIARMVEHNTTMETMDMMIRQRIATDTWAMSESDLKRIKELFDKADKYGQYSEEAEKLYTEAYAIAAKSLGTKSFMEKWNAWRYLAMLGNPRTHIRNILGNTAFGSVVTNIKDAVGVALESQYAKNHDIEKTKAIVSRATDSELFEGASKYYKANAYGLATDGDSKYGNLETEIKREQRTFKSDFLEALNKFNSDLLTKEDNYAIKRKYEHALAGYLKANGKGASIFTSTNQADIDLLNRASEYAIKEAKVATFHEVNKFAKAITAFSHSAQHSNSLALKGLGYGIESVMPFKTTPANLLKQGIEYSPAGIVKGISQIRSEADVTVALDTISKGLTGSGIMMLGMLLSSMGVLRGDDNDDKEGKLFGEQAYSINIGGHSYTIDWLAPAALPLFVGAEMYKAYEGDGEFIDAITSISQPIIEMSMLQGFNNLLESIANKNGSTNAAATILTDIGTGYLTQSVPTLAGQIARTIDPKRRVNYTNQSGIKGSLEYVAEKTQNKIPGLSQSNAEYVDEWGDKQENTGGNVVMRALNNMVFPGYYSNTNVNEFKTKVRDLSKAVPDENILPDKVGKKYEDQLLTAEENQKYQEESGKLYTEGVSAVFKDANYDKLSLEEQASVVSDMKKFTNALTKANVFDDNITESSTYKKVYNIYKEQGFEGLAKYYVNNAAVRTAYGESGAIPVLKLAETVGKLDMTDEERGEYMYTQLSDPADTAKQAKVDRGYSGFYDYYRIKSEALVDKDVDDKTELIAYLKKSNMSIEDKYYWFKLFYPKATDIPTLY